MDDSMVVNVIYNSETNIIYKNDHMLPVSDCDIILTLDFKENTIKKEFKNTWKNYYYEKIFENIFKPYTSKINEYKFNIDTYNYNTKNLFDILLPENKNQSNSSFLQKKELMYNLIYSLINSIDSEDKLNEFHIYLEKLLLNNIFSITRNINKSYIQPEFLIVSYNEANESFDTIDIQPIILKITIEQPLKEFGVVVKDKKGFAKTDSSLRDNERIPLGVDIQDYFEKEVKPHLPESWMDRSKDSVGYEINFTK
jgi:hypothetical protein